MEHNHTHDHEHDHEHEHDENNFGPDFVTIVDEDGKEYEMEFLDSIELDGKTYYAFCEAGLPDDVESVEVSIFRVDTNDDDTEELVGLDDEDELERVYDKFLFQQEDDEDEE